MGMVIDTRGEDHETTWFDTWFKLQEVTDYSVQHLRGNGVVVRCQRVLLKAGKYSNAGGVVSKVDYLGNTTEKIRDSKLEKEMFLGLMHKWPGAFKKSSSSEHWEVILQWGKWEKVNRWPQNHKK